MHPDLQRYFTHVWPLFWPWLVWNLVRVARWHARTGREALMAVDCFGNIRLVCLADAPPPDALYTYEAPRIPRWERPAVRGAVLAPVRVWSTMVRHDPAKSGMVMHRHDFVRYRHGAHVRDPPWRGPPPNSALFTGWQLPVRTNVLGHAPASQT